MVALLGEVAPHAHQQEVAKAPFLAVGPAKIVLLDPAGSEEALGEVPGVFGPGTAVPNEGVNRVPVALTERGERRMTLRCEGLRRARDEAPGGGGEG